MPPLCFVLHSQLAIYISKYNYLSYFYLYFIYLFYFIITFLGIMSVSKWVNVFVGEKGHEGLVTEITAASLDDVSDLLKAVATE